MTRGVMEHAHLPEELVEDILHRLSVWSLLRFKSVCKSWNCLIENPNFVAKHHDRSNSPSYLLLHRRIADKDGPELSLICKKTFQRQATDPHLVLPSFLAESYFPRFLRPCNGVVFVSFGDNINSALYNPATREIKSLPEPGGPFPPDYVLDKCSYGYGFDATSNDYKVVRVSYWVLEEDPDEDLEYANRVLVPELYSLTLDAWRKLDVKVPAGPFKLQLAGLFSDTGMFAWLALDDVPYQPKVHGRESLVTFNMRDENFTATYLPEVYNTKGEIRPYNIYTEFSFTTLNGSIAMVYHAEKPERCLQVWVLNEIGNPDSWTNLYNLWYNFGFISVLGFLKEDQMFLSSADEAGTRQLILANPVNLTTRYLPLPQKEGRTRGIRIFEFKESLVKLTRHG